MAGVASSCALVINLVALLQGASVSTSSIILHELENSSHHVQVNILFVLCICIDGTG